MNKYYKVNTSYEYVAVRKSAFRYNPPGEPVKAIKKLREKAKLGLIPVFISTHAGLVRI